MVDWFQPIPVMDVETGNIKAWSEYVPLLKDFLKEKIYLKSGKRYLLLTDFQESFMFSKGEG